MRADDGSEIETFQGLLEFGRFTQKTKLANPVQCTEMDFKSARKQKWNPVAEFAELPKQCYCEPEPKYEPYHCSEDGGQCSCKKGRVFYGIKNKLGNESRMAAFDDVTDAQFTMVDANNTDYVFCDPTSFEGVDPAPGIDKECYCDDQKKVDAALTNYTLDYWRGI